VFGTVAQIPVPLASEWCVLKALIGDLAGRRQMIDGEPPEE
jgi:hypothetical protein